ncbi:aquaporin-like protein [Bimuria novae-zelandiae CBS 107.79]|uniref:Aquaporin-like protein n=1 Tax=Bimuria novae-zelandiae CBS 107.79 TaxID=1447943 RepID=A0A6A5V3U5_9PLEO|nr:aquaporin-like protein [Bimuria novae-zelandiae CBS 107.79]
MPRLNVPRPSKHNNDKGYPTEPRHANHISAFQAHIIAATWEFVGTFMFLYFSFACQIMLHTQASETSTQIGGASSQQNVFTALVHGFSLLVNVWAFYRIKVTFGLVLVGSLPPIRGLFLFPAQLLAGMSAGGLVQAMFPGDIKLCSTTLSTGTSIAQGVFIEIAFFAMMGGIYYTGGSLNPTRSFGPAVAGTSFPGYHWIHWVGPLLSAAVAAGYYRFVKYFTYEEVNPGKYLRRYSSSRYPT